MHRSLAGLGSCGGSAIGAFSRISSISFWVLAFRACEMRAAEISFLGFCFVAALPPFPWTFALEPGPLPVAFPSSSTLAAS